MARFFDTVRQAFHRGGMLEKLIYINVGVFLLLRIGALVIMLAGGDPQQTWVSWLELPSSIDSLLCRPWTLLTYMFAQYDLLHILFNMLWLYWFGRFFMFTSTPRQLVGLYITGGLAGAALYLLAMNMLPYFQYVHGVMLGASASVMAIVVATAWRMPDYRINLLFIGGVALKWIAAVTVLLSLLNIPGENSGGNIAHIGGAIAGMLYGMSMSRGRDITRPLNAVIDGCVNLWHRITAPRRTSTPPPRKPSPARDREAMDAILDKIKKSGYSSLTPEERARLFDVSKKIK